MYQTLRNKLTSKAFMLLAAAAVVVLSSATVLAPPNFTGEWKLNEGKSELGQFARAAKKIKVESVDAQGISFERTSTNQDGAEVVRKEKLTFDGKEVESTGGFANSKTKSKASISDVDLAALCIAMVDGYGAGHRHFAALGGCTGDFP